MQARNGKPINPVKPIMAALSLLLAISPGLAQEGVWTDVFNGKDLTGLAKRGNGTITVDAANKILDVNGGNGYLHTEKEYAHYRARVEWKNLGGGNAGYLHHVDLTKHACGAWPSGPELQMMQGDVGSVWTTDCKFNSTGTGDKFNPTGPALTGFGQYGCGRSHFIRPENKEKPGDWNSWELFVKGDSLEVKVNGAMVMRLSKLTMGGDAPMVKGKMGLQIEGARVHWRNWQVMDLTAPTKLMPRQGAKDAKAGLAWSAVVEGQARFAFTREGLPAGSESGIFDAAGKALLLVR
jgi:hypothetical protein